MKSLGEIETILSKQKPTLRREFGVESLGIFGSVVRNEQTRGSDVDILVDFAKPVGMFTFLELEEHLGHVLDTKVDLVTRNALKPRIGESILREVKPV